MKNSLHLLYAALMLACNLNSGFAQQKQGDTITVAGAKYKLATANLVTNPGFEDGFTGWTDGTTSAPLLNSTNFTVVSTGGIDNSKYLVGIKNEGSATAGSIGTGWSLQAGKKYYFSYHVKYLTTTAAAGSEDWCKVSLTNNKTFSTEPLILINSSKVDGGGKWTRNEVVFTNTTPYSYIMARFRWLNNRLGFDNFSLFEVNEVINTADLQAAINEAQVIYKPEAPGATELQAAISTAQSFMASETPSVVTKAIADLKAAVVTYKLLGASPENPLDMTSFIVNQGFNDNTSVGWKGIGVINNHIVEFYQRTFNMQQKIAGLPAGKYVLKAQGFERPKANDGGAAYRAGTETISARFYAKANSFPEKNAAFCSLYKHSYNGTGSQSGYINTMASAETFMANANNYAVTVTDILLKQGDTLTVGTRTSFQQSGYWAVFDNFRLEFHGNFNETDLQTALNRQIAVAQELLLKKMQAPVRENLNTAIAQAQQAAAAIPLVSADLSSSNDLINAAIRAANTSADIYVKLQSVIDDAATLAYQLTTVKAQNLPNVLATARNSVNDLNATSVVLNKSITDVSAIIYKRIHIPTWMMGNVNDVNNNWSMVRSRQSKNWIVFWEPGYGEDPSVLADANYRINVDGLLGLAEQFFDFYADSLKFITRATSKTGDYKMIIRLRYTRDWEATGSGVDDMIGLLTLTAWSAQAGGHTLAHEVGHCFQYQTHCDNNNQNGWMYGYGSNASGNNGWWEQCAQWQGFKIFPAQQFTDGRFTNYLNTAHKHILHEAPRYDNYFIQDYWTFKRGMNIIGRLWNESVRPEDPVETYKRIMSINQSQFNNEIHEHAARFATWDIPVLRSYGESKISARPQPKLNNAGNNYWMIDATVCPENYGYNVIKLNAPTKATTVLAFFEGKAGIDGYRKNYVTSAGWRYGFVALFTNGTRVYSEIGAASYLIPADTLRFDCPDNCKQLWLVVSGAPSAHWRHAWDDDDTNDEQWPYMVKFNNTNLMGYQNIINSIDPEFGNDVAIYNSGNTLHITGMPTNATVKVYTLTGTCILNQKAYETSFSATLPSGVHIVSIIANEGNYNRKVIIP